MLWIALQPASEPLAWLALQFSPRVARLEDAVVLEVEASLRLFGGARGLHRRLQAQAAEAGMELPAPRWASTSLAALALTRSGRSGHAVGERLTPMLDAMPLAALSAVQAQAPMLSRLGCRSLAEVRALPRTSLARRFGPAMLKALDQAYGEAPEAHQWLTLPDHFEARLELPFRVDQALALQHHAEGLLRSLCAWLAARHLGLRTCTLAWTHDAMRARDAGDGGALEITTAGTTREFRHLARLLGEHLQRLELAAPVSDLRLSAHAVEPLAPSAASLLVTSGDEREPLALTLERLSVRLGAQQVRVGQLCEDHRLEAMQQWHAWPQQITTKARPAQGPQPTWLIDPPQRLSTQQDQPLYRGPLQKLLGPQRVESGWWDGQVQQRDYYLFHSEQAGLLWIYAERLPEHEPGWFLQGVFA
jgi:protein ImuB